MTLNVRSAASLKLKCMYPNLQWGEILASIKRKSLDLTEKHDLMLLCSTVAV